MDAVDQLQVHIRENHIVLEDYVEEYLQNEFIEHLHEVAVSLSTNSLPECFPTFPTPYSVTIPITFLCDFYFDSKERRLFAITNNLITGY